ncbi:asparagine synthase (glutamine-hydrolyzing) [Candidatus Vecturithrix granuli]|uniref:asparagine synthase (glutamine-hydrolyzing) n=1 Tax=Vecturithrix granuli TaxID=1499967 RepID=A0A0S6WAB7_VECG1|nr:asparagine synthase (glutamine-hydrolyzing) [Candidatus Vecturithrix granuli]
MCGIAGFTSFKEYRIDVRDTIEKMNTAIQHRGPDDQGVYIDQYAALGNRRLSIIDLSSGKQPIHNEDRTLWIVFNGEIYNFPELRDELFKKGHEFYTHTDTEVILHLYEEYGTDCVKQLNGMFAFAIWHVNERTLFLARDRIGIKPLHYMAYPGGLIFASEIKAMLQHPLVERQLDVEGLSKYLTYEYIPAPHSIFKGIKKLKPGQWLLHTEQVTQIRQYWDIPFEETGISYKREEEHAEEILARLKESVRKRLLSDVPVGVLLSGGLDSSTISLLASQAAPGQIQSFSIGFEEPSFDETRYAQKVARLLGTQHHHQVFNSQKMLEVVPSVIKILDEPMADASIIPTYLLSQMTAQHVKVALGGDGADELFAGYPTYQAHKLVTYYSVLPYKLRDLINRFATHLPVSHRNISFDFKVKQFLRGMGVSSEIRFFLWMGAFLEREKQQVFSDDTKNALVDSNPFEDVIHYVHESKLLKDFERILYLSLKLYLQDDILVKVDRASMANSLEVRVPYLDHTFVEYVAGLPSLYKLRGLTTKYLLKQATKDLLPKEIVQRKKKGFGIPLSKWFHGELKPMLLSYLSEERIKTAGIFHYPYIKHLLDEHFSRQYDHRKQLWTLLVFEMWREEYLL